MNQVQGYKEHVKEFKHQNKNKQKQTNHQLIKSF